MTTPVSAPADRRIIQLDALRGLAVIGIVWMNVHVFAFPAQGYYNPIAWSGSEVGAAGPLDRLVWTASFVFVEDKFRTLFVMLFGAGCVILLEKDADRKWRRHFARMAVLFAIGLVHATLFANNDILRAYALAGCALPFLASLGVRALVAVALGLIMVHFASGFAVFGGAIYDWSRGIGSTDAALFAERNFGLDPWAIQYWLEQGRESFGERVVRRVDGIPDQLTNIAATVPINLAAIALGIALWKGRMFAGGWRTFHLQRLAAICALVSIPALFALAMWVSDNEFPGALAGSASLVFSAPFDTALGVAYAALAMAFFTPDGAVTRLLASVGRLSLTNYLMTSVILAALFANWGLGLFGTVNRAQALALSFVPIAAMLAWSPVWTKQFGQGPFERLWRRLARLIG